MKTLLVFPQKDNQTGLFILRALKDLGCEVKTVDPKICPKTTAAEASAFKPDFVLCSRTPDLADEIPKLKKWCPKAILACWNVDKKYDIFQFGPKLVKLFKQMDLMYTIALGNVAQYKKIMPPTSHVIHLQQGCDPLTHKTEILTAQDRKLYNCDVLFAGSLKSCGGDRVEKQRTQLISKINKNFNLLRYGQKGNRIIDTAANKAYNYAKINLGHNGWPDIGISMSVRDYKIMGAGGFLLTQYCKKMETWFDLDKECVAYKTDRECLEKIKYYLNNPEERKIIAKNGQKAVYENHTYKIRIKKMLSDVENEMKKGH